MLLEGSSIGLSGVQWVSHQGLKGPQRVSMEASHGDFNLQCLLVVYTIICYYILENTGSKLH